MKALLLWPILPNSFWSYQETLELAGLRSTNPPLDLIKVAAMLPSEWEIRFFDRNVCLETNADWEWCDLAIVAANIAQKVDVRSLLKKAIAFGKKIALSGSLPTLSPEFALAAKANYLILDEEQGSIPLFLTALKNGEECGIFQASQQVDITQAPIPRFDLLNLNAYLAMTVQFSHRSNLCSHKFATKTPEQMLAELEVIYQRGWHRSVWFTGDDFLGNKSKAKEFLQSLIPWMEKRHYPFSFLAETSWDLAEEDELIELMVKAGFTKVAIDLETPAMDNLVAINKLYPHRESIEACNKITRLGLQIVSSCIMGCDRERLGVGKRFQDFIEETGIPNCQVNLLQAFPHTPLWKRLEKEGRLVNNLGTFYKGAIMNFVPSRPVEEITEEYIETFWQIYEPMPFLKRTFRYFMMMKGVRPKTNLRLTWTESRLFLAVCWRQGVIRETRFQFWWQLLAIALSKPELISDYMMALGLGEHFFNYRHLAKAKLLSQLFVLKQAKQEKISYSVVVDLLAS